MTFLHASRRIHLPQNRITRHLLASRVAPQFAMELSHRTQGNLHDQSHPSSSASNHDGQQRAVRRSVRSSSVTDNRPASPNGEVDGGRQANRALVGSWISLLPASDLLNSMGILQTSLSQDQLRHLPESQISWIFSIFAFLFFFGGIVVGPLYDKYRLWPMMPIGYHGLALSLLLLSFCSSYYQYVLCLSVLGGASASVVWNRTIANLTHWFHSKQGLAVGLATSAGGIGGIIIPIILQRLKSQLDFHWAVRVLALITMVCSSIGIILTRSRLPGDRAIKLVGLDWAGFRDNQFSLTIVATLVIDWAVLVPPAYLTLNAIQNGVNPVAAGYILAAMNASATLGRILPGFAADKLGRFNIMILCSTVCSMLCFSMWLNMGSNLGVMFTFAILYGFFSGPAYSLTPVCVAQLCRPGVYPRRYGTAYGIFSLATLVGVPLSGLVLGSREEARYSNLVMLCGASTG